MHPFANADYINDLLHDDGIDHFGEQVDDEDNMLGEDDGFNNYGQEYEDFDDHYDPFHNINQNDIYDDDLPGQFEEVYDYDNDY